MATKKKFGIGIFLFAMLLTGLVVEDYYCTVKSQCDQNGKYKALSSVS